MDVAVQNRTEEFHEIVGVGNDGVCGQRVNDSLGSIAQNIFYDRNRHRGGIRLAHQWILFDGRVGDVLNLERKRFKTV